MCNEARTTPLTSPCRYSYLYLCLCQCSSATYDLAGKYDCAKYVTSQAEQAQRGKSRTSGATPSNFANETKIVSMVELTMTLVSKQSAHLYSFISYILGCINLFTTSTTFRQSMLLCVKIFCLKEGAQHFVFPRELLDSCIKYASCRLRK